MSSATSLGLALESGIDSASGVFSVTGSVKRRPGCAELSTHATVAPLPLNATSVVAPWSTCSAPLLMLSSEPPVPVAGEIYAYAPPVARDVITPDPEASVYSVLVVWERSTESMLVPSV